MQVTDRTPQHPEHDPFLIAQYAADDLRPSERSRATELIETCRECASLAIDLQAIAAATSALPPITARRDFRLTDADAARLRRGSWRRHFGFLGSPRFAFTQPLGLGMATIGLAGLLISGVGFGSRSAALPASAPNPGAEVQAPAPAAGGAAGDSAVAATDEANDATRSGTAASAAPATAAPAAAAPAVPAPTAAPTALPMVAASPEESFAIMAAPADASAEPTPADPSIKNGASAPPETTDGVAEAGTPGAEPTGAADRDTLPTQVTGPQPTADAAPSWSAWLVLILAGLAIAILRPIARRLTRR